MSLEEYAENYARRLCNCTSCSHFKECFASKSFCLYFDVAKKSFLEGTKFSRGQHGQD